MKLVCVTDVHFGVRGSSVQFHEFMVDFFYKQFIPYLTDNGISHVVFLGDTVEHRKFVTFYASNLVRKLFLDLSKIVNVTVIIGNHDLNYRDSSEIDAMNELISGNTSVNIIGEPTTLEFDGSSIDFIPWIHEGNKEKTLQFIKDSQSLIAFGHFELSGFKMYKAAKEDHGGIPAEFLKKYTKVLSGHYHHKSDNGHVYYLGTPYELTWSDYNDPKGFHVFDTRNNHLEFIENKERMFHVLTLKDKDSDVSYLKNRFVRMIREQTDDAVQFDAFLTKVKDANPLNLTIETRDDATTQQVDVAEESQSITELIELHIDESGFEDIMKTKLKQTFTNLYTEALNVEATS